eukprot:5566037-Prymnesium_polylepis.1
MQEAVDEPWVQQESSSLQFGIMLSRGARASAQCSTLNGTGPVHASPRAHNASREAERKEKRCAAVSYSLACTLPIFHGAGGRGPFKKSTPPTNTVPVRSTRPRWSMRFAFGHGLSVRGLVL